MTENNVVLTELEIEVEELEQMIAPSGSLAVDDSHFGRAARSKLNEARPAGI